MSEEHSQESAPYAFEVEDADGVRRTLELLETFRIEIEGRVCDYCLVRATPPETEDDDALLAEILARDEFGDEDEDEDGYADSADDDLRAYRLEDDGLASPRSGEETVLLSQALWALQRVLAEEALPEEPEPRHLLSDVAPNDRH